MALSDGAGATWCNLATFVSAEVALEPHRFKRSG